jgi:hypothetical protein
VVGEFGNGGGGDVAAFGGDHLVVDLDEERADEPDDTLASGPWTHAGRVVLLHQLRQVGFTRLNRSLLALDRCSRRRCARPGDCPAGSPDTEDACPANRARRSQSASQESGGRSSE